MYTLSLGDAVHCRLYTVGLQRPQHPILLPRAGVHGERRVTDALSVDVASVTSREFEEPLVVHVLEDLPHGGPLLGLGFQETLEHPQQPRREVGEALWGPQSPSFSPVDVLRVVGVRQVRLLPRQLTRQENVDKDAELPHVLLTKVVKIRGD